MDAVLRLTADEMSVLKQLVGKEVDRVNEREQKNLLCGYSVPERVALETLRDKVQ